MPESAPEQPTAETPGSQDMPAWNTGELIDAPKFTSRNWFALLGPGLIMGGSAIGGGEWLLGPKVTGVYGGGLLWVATISILGQVIYNIEICRYTLYTGEPIFTGKFRMRPGPKFWVFAYLLFDFDSVFPYLAANAAIPVATLINRYVYDAGVPDPESVTRDFWMVKTLGYLIFLGALIPLLFGGRIYRSLKAVMTFKLIVVFGFLLFLAFGFSKSSTWAEIGKGFVSFGNVPVQRGEDINANGVLDPGEDWDGDGRLDVNETLPDNPDEFSDVDGDGYRDGRNVDSIWSMFSGGAKFSDIDFTMIGFIAALAAIAGSGGLSNTPTSNYTRDQGWGMGHHVGAIPSVVGGHGIELSHTGTVFKVSDESLPRWKRWYKHIVRDQMALFLPSCFVGIALPAMLSIQFLTYADADKGDSWNMAVMTADGVRNTVSASSSEGLGAFCWFMTVFCGFMVLAPTMSSSADGIIRRWVDAFWTASSRLRELDPKFIRVVYFRVLVGYAIFGLVMLSLNPGDLVTYATMFFNIALGISCWHTVAINTTLLPPALRPHMAIRGLMILSGLYFFMLGVISVLQKTGLLDKLTG